jgi:outer membrane protein OmpA-like peptidoglycan-associated protein
VKLFTKASASVALSATVLLGASIISASVASATPATFRTDITVVHVLTSSVTQAPSDSVYDAQGNLWIEYNGGLVKVSKAGVETQILSTSGQTWPVANPSGTDGSTGYLGGNLAFSNGCIYFTDGELGIARVAASLNHLAITSDIHMVVDTSNSTNTAACSYDSRFYAVDAHGNVEFDAYDGVESRHLCIHSATAAATSYSVFEADSYGISAIALGLDGTGLFVLVPNKDGSFTDHDQSGMPIGPGFTGLIAGNTGELDNTACTVRYDANNCVITQEPSQIVKICSNPGGGVIIRPFDVASSNRGPVYSRVLALTKAIKAAGEMTVTLTGYTDNTGSANFNATLSHQRALEVKTLLKKFLISMKDGAVMITIVAGGSSNPVASNATAAGRALNRRVEANF